MPGPLSSVAELTAALLGREVTARSVLEESLQRIERFDGLFNAVLTLSPDAVEQAAASDQRLRSGAARSLEGVPILVKDNIDVRGMPTTAGALALEGRVPAEDAFLVARLREAGAVVVGKVNLTELANFMTTGMPSGYSSLGGQVLNPYDLALTPSGSSSGSATAVALGYVPVAVGTETDGSITSPSLHQSLVGLKPSVGVVSRQGIVPISPSQDTAGPMARTVADAAALLAAMVAGGTDPDDHVEDGAAEACRRLCAPLEASSLSGRILRFVEVGTIEASAEAGTDTAEVSAVYQPTLDALRSAGADLRVAGMPPDGEEDELTVLVHEFAPAVDAYLRRPTAGEHPVASMADLAEWNRRHEGEALKYGQVHVEAALAAAGREYSEARERDASFTRDALGAAMEGADAVVFPGVGGATWAARAGWPCVALPAGYGSASRRPVGITIVARRWGDAELLGLAAAVEEVLPRRRHPWEVNPAAFRRF